jgi:hypothetical protein
LEQYQEEVKKHLDACKSSSLDEEAENFSKALRVSADLVIGSQKNNKKPWISQKTLALVEERHHIKSNERFSSSKKTEYNRLTHQIRHSMNTDYENWCNERCEEIESLQKTHRVREMHQKIKELTCSNKLKDAATVIGSKEGKLLTTDAAIRDRWSEYCNELYNFDLKVDPTILDSLWKDQTQEPIADLLMCEVTDAIAKLKKGKAAGIDGVVAELIKGGGDAVASSMFDICQKAWNEEKFPSIWCKSVIITLPKKGDLRLCENHRTISLISHSSKVLLEIIRKRLKPYIEGNLSHTQAGFRPGRGTIEQIHTWKQLAERYLETQNGQLVNVFIDFKKAFDRVWHMGMFRVLQHYNIPRKLCTLIKSLYDQAVSAVRIGSDISDWFSQSVGVRQGCILSPDLFNLFLEHILAEAKEAFDTEYGVLVNGERVTDLCFADDIDVVSDSIPNAQNMLHHINESSKHYGLEISKEKTKAMLVSTETMTLDMKIDGSPIEQVSQFKYLGSYMTNDNSSAIDIRSRIAQAMAALQKLEYVWKNNRISLMTKLRLLDSTVIPTAIYGCETWTIHKHDMQRIKAFGMKCLRRILGVHWSDHVPNADICFRTNRSEDFVPNIVKKRQHTWLGHVLRMDGERLLLKSLQAHGLDTRKKGRPKTRWLDSVLGYSGLSLPQALIVARNRNDWRRSF